MRLVKSYFRRKGTHKSPMRQRFLRKSAAGGAFGIKRRVFDTKSSLGLAYLRNSAYLCRRFGKQDCKPQPIVDSKQDILHYLVGHHFFAPNPGRLAALLGQRGRMNITRLMEGTLGDRAAENLWRDICEQTGVAKGLMPYLPEVWELSELLKQAGCTLSVSIPPAEQMQPAGMDNATWQRIVALYQQDTMLIYILQAIIYAKQHDINPYRQAGAQGLKHLVGKLDDQLHPLYPAQINAHDAAQEMMRGFDESDIDSWWRMGIVGGTLLRLYHDPSYGSVMFDNGGFPMPFADQQWWRAADGNTLWYWQKNGSRGIAYDVMRVEDGQNAGQAIHFYVLFLDDGVLRLMQYDGDNTRSCYVEWQQETYERNRILRFGEIANSKLRGLLPRELVTLDAEHDDRALVHRAQTMDKDITRETVLRTYGEMGLLHATDWRLVDVECSRRTLKVLFRHADSTQTQVARFPLNKQPNLRVVSVDSPIDLFLSTRDGRLYAFWNDLGILLPLTDKEV